MFYQGVPIAIIGTPTKALMGPVESKQLLGLERQESLEARLTPSRSFFETKQRDEKPPETCTTNIGLVDLQKQELCLCWVAVKPLTQSWWRHSSACSPVDIY